MLGAISPNSGAWVSTDGGQTTIAASASPLMGGSAFGLCNNRAAGDLWLGTEQNGIYRSTDNGLNWTAASPPDEQIDRVNGDTRRKHFRDHLRPERKRPLRFHGGIWKSTKTSTGYTWTNGLPNPNTPTEKVWDETEMGTSITDTITTPRTPPSYIAQLMMAIHGQRPIQVFHPLSKGTNSSSILGTASCTPLSKTAPTTTAGYIGR